MCAGKPGEPKNEHRYLCLSENLIAKHLSRVSSSLGYSKVDRQATTATVSIPVDPRRTTVLGSQCSAMECCLGLTKNELRNRKSSVDYSSDRQFAQAARRAGILFVAFYFFTLLKKSTPGLRQDSRLRRFYPRTKRLAR